MMAKWYSTFPKLQNSRTAVPSPIAVQRDA